MNVEVTEIPVQPKFSVNLQLTQEEFNLLKRFTYMVDRCDVEAALGRLSGDPDSEKTFDLFNVLHEELCLQTE